MTINWNKLILNLTIWAIAEIALNFIGLDTLADYSEFLLTKNQTRNTYPAANIQ